MKYCGKKAHSGRFSEAITTFECPVATGRETPIDPPPNYLTHEDCNSYTKPS